MRLKSVKSELLSLKNVGQATLKNLQALGIDNIKQLRSQTADHLYEKLTQITGKRQDPCVWDVFSAIIHEAKTGEKLPWWHWSSIRKTKKKDSKALISATKEKSRCFGNGVGKEFYAQYHDNEWGVPVYEDRLLFEMLILEGAQAGLSWETVLKKREAYRHAFCHFDPTKVAKLSDAQLEKHCQNPQLIRNTRKIFSVRQNAQVFLSIQKAFGTFSKYLWAYVDGQPILNHWNSFEQVPVSTPLSETISKDLKKRGMNFVGPTIIYAYCQAVGLVNDHLTSCWCYKLSSR